MKFTKHIRNIRHVGRLAQIANVFAKQGLWTLVESIGLPAWLTPEQLRAAEELSRTGGTNSKAANWQDVPGMASRLRRAFEELGPAFVKLGQLLAVRRDLLPKDFTDELGKLHSDVRGLPYSQIKKILQEELGDGLLEKFKSIDENPLAAGSIAQVHRAVLKNDIEVVVKVQRPGVDSAMSIDLSLMSELAGLVEKYLPETRIARPQNMIEEFKRAVLGELDFLKEAGNIGKITQNLQEIENIKIPEVYWDLTTTKVLTQTILHKHSSWDKDEIKTKGLNSEKLVETGMSMLLKMVLVDGIYHGDLHPGNILVMEDDQIGLIDFGLCVYLGRSARENVAGLLMSLATENYERVVLNYIELTDPNPDFDAKAFERDLTNVLAPLSGLNSAGGGRGKMATSKMFWELAEIAARHGAPLPQDIITFVKTVASFEGIAVGLDPRFNILSAASKYASDIAGEMYHPERLKQDALVIARDMGLLAKQSPYQLRRLLKAALASGISIRLASSDLGHLSRSLDKASSRLSISIVCASLFVTAGLLLASGTGRHLYSLSVPGLVALGVAGFAAFLLMLSFRGKR